MTTQPAPLPEHVPGKIITVKLADLIRYYQVNGLEAVNIKRHDEPVIVKKVEMK